MLIEEEIFQRTRVDFNKLETYGFQKNSECYEYSKEFMDQNFRADIQIDKYGKVIGKVMDLQFEEEYTNIRIDSHKGEFVNTVRLKYKEILLDIKNHCFENVYFLFEQSNRITKYIIKKYQDEPEFLWEKYSGYGVFRNKKNEKWYAGIFNIDQSKLRDGKGEVEILNIKLENEKIDLLLKEKGFYEGYHMNKKNWVSIILDDTISDERICSLIDESYSLVSSPSEWIVPANPKYYDMIHCFDDTDTMEWKQSSDVQVGDIVYVYVGAPISSILYKCEAIEINIPLEYKDENLTIHNVMRLRLLKRYESNEIRFAKMNELGIKSIRGPRKISKEVSKRLEK